MSAQLVLLHVGLPKTATTWLQACVFDNRALGFISPFGARAAQAIDTFVLHPTFQFSEDDARKDLSPALSAAWREKLVPVISEETLLGNIVSGHYWGESVIQNIRKTFSAGTVRVLLTIREQKSLILSAYKEYVLVGGHASLERYLWAGPKRVGFRGIFHLDALKYDVIYKRLAESFSAASVMVLAQEEMQRDPNSAVRRLQSWLGMENSAPVSAQRIHVGSGGFTLRLRSILNRYVPTRDVFADRVPFSRKAVEKLCRVVDKHAPKWIQQKYETNYRNRVEQIVGNYFDESNKRFDEYRVCSESYVERARET